MNAAQRGAAVMMGKEVNGSKLVSQFEAIEPGENVTLQQLKDTGLLLCAWVKALSGQVAPPEDLPDKRETAVFQRVVDLARGADATALKAGHAVQPVCASLHDHAVAINEEQAKQ